MGVTAIIQDIQSRKWFVRSGSDSDWNDQGRGSGRIRPKSRVQLWWSKRGIRHLQNEEQEWKVESVIRYLYIL